MHRDKIIVAGAGGQGALLIGQMIAYAALDEGWEVEWFPSYGAEMRGGTANCSLVISKDEIPFSMVKEPDYCIIMNDLSLAKFECRVRPGGVIILDSSRILKKIDRSDLNAYYVPAGLMAEEAGNARGANMVLLGAYLAVAGKVSLESLYKVMDRSFTGVKAKYAEPNKRLIQSGYEFIERAEKKEKQRS